MNVMVSLSNTPMAHPPRSNPFLRSSSDAPPFPCITPSTVTCVMVVSFMIAVPFSLGAPLAGGLSPLLRTPLPRSDTASRISFEDFLVRRLRTIRLVEAIAGHLRRPYVRPAAFAALRRISTFRLPAFDPSVASLSATSRSKASMIQKPARYFSFPNWVGLGHTAGTGRSSSYSVAWRLVVAGYATLGQEIQLVTSWIGDRLLISRSSGSPPECGTALYIRNVLVQRNTAGSGLAKSLSDVRPRATAWSCLDAGASPGGADVLARESGGGQVRRRESIGNVNPSRQWEGRPHAHPTPRPCVSSGRHACRSRRSGIRSCSAQRGNHRQRQGRRHCGAVDKRDRMCPEGLGPADQYAVASPGARHLVGHE